MTTVIFLAKKHRIELPEDARGRDLFEKCLQITRLPLDQLRITYEANGKRIPVYADQLISETGAKDFRVKDLGPQFSYYGVYIFEYMGPLLIWLLFWVIMKSCSLYHILSSLMWIIHYSKRLLETHFVHIFSHGTMPLFNLFRNCVYYWCFAVMISYSVLSSDKQVGRLQTVAFLLFFVCEYCNLRCHLILRNLRKTSQARYACPSGFLFDWILCPNYTMEILSWICFAIVTRVIPAYLFPVVGGIQMFAWANTKKKRLAALYPELRTRGSLSPWPFL